MTGSRFIRDTSMTLERLKKFVALDNLTAQIPLIEVCTQYRVRIWTAYDPLRVHGTYTEVDSGGCVRTITVYPSGKRHETINRPADRIAGVRKGKKPRSVASRSKRAKSVYAEAQSASAKK
jgi:hypothetical protein